MATKTPVKRGKASPAPRYFKGHGKLVARFAETRLLQTKGRWQGQPLLLEPWQRDLLDELFLVDSGGKRVYKEALIGLPRKNGKSTLGSAIALHGLVATGEGGPEVYAAAASEQQARVVFQQAREYVEASPYLSQWLRPLRSAIRCTSNNGIFRVLSADGPLAHGLNPSLVVIDELWAHKNPELYYALTTGMIAREEPLVVSITTAGFDRDTICWDVYQRGMALQAQGIDAMRAAGFFFHWHTAPPKAKVSSKKTWKDANPSSWVTEEVLEREFERLPEAVFRRLHLNQWTESEDSWISPHEWDACVGKPKINGTDPVFMGLDIGQRRDATALIIAQWHKDKLHIRHDIRVPREGVPVASQDMRAVLSKLATKYGSLRDVAFDPYQFTESAEMLGDEGLPMMRYEQTNANMCPASERLYELVREGRLVHDGSPELRQHVLAAVAADTERGWRISKRKSKERIDAAIALTMAADRAVEWLIGGQEFDLSDYRITAL